MKELKNTKRATVHLGYDGKIYKKYLGPLARERYDNEVRILRFLSEKNCNFVPKLLSRDPQELSIVMSYCGKQATQLSDDKVSSIFDELESYGVKHDDPFLRNITYDDIEGRFCVIDFEFAELHALGMGLPVDTEDHRVVAKKPEIKWIATGNTGRRHDSFVAIKLSLEQFHYVGDEGSVSMDEGDFVFALSKSQESAAELLVKEAISDGIRKILISRFELTSSGIIAGGRDLVHDVYRHVCEKLKNYQKNYDEFKCLDASLSFCWFTPFAVYYFHVGKGAIFHQPKAGELKRLTQIIDVGDQVPDNVYKLKVDTGVVEYAALDRFIIISEEINNELSDDEISNTAFGNDIALFPSSLDSLFSHKSIQNSGSAIIIEIAPHL